MGRKTTTESIVLGSTPALVNPSLAVHGSVTIGAAGSMTPALNLQRELGGSDSSRVHTPPKVASRSVHGTLFVFCYNTAFLSSSLVAQVEQSVRCTRVCVVCVSEMKIQIHGRRMNKKLSYRRVTARCVLSVVILPITTQQCRNYLYDKS